MVLSCYRVGKPENPWQNLRNLRIDEIRKTVANKAFFIVWWIYSRTRFYVSQAVKAGSTPVSCSNKKDTRQGVFFIGENEGRESNRSNCNSPVDCCSRGLDRGTPLFSPTGRENANRPPYPPQFQEPPPAVFLLEQDTKGVERTSVGDSGRSGGSRQGWGGQTWFSSVVKV